MKYTLGSMARVPRQRDRTSPWSCVQMVPVSVHIWKTLLKQAQKEGVEDLESPLSNFVSFLAGKQAAAGI